MDELRRFSRQNYWCNFLRFCFKCTDHLKLSQLCQDSCRKVKDGWVVTVFTGLWFRDSVRTFCLNFLCVFLFNPCTFGAHHGYVLMWNWCKHITCHSSVFIPSSLFPSLPLPCSIPWDSFPCERDQYPGAGDWEEGTP